MARTFRPAILDRFEKTKYLYIRTGDHRFIPIWVVVVERRVIVRSWNNKRDGWYQAFLSQPHGEVRMGNDHDGEVPVRAAGLRSARLNDAADAAYAAKYTTKANAKYVKGFKNPKRKANTLELVPV